MEQPVRLSEEQARHYRDQGYVKLGRVLTDSQLRDMREEEGRFRSKIAPSRVEAGRTLFMAQMCARSVTLRAISTGGLHLEAVKQLVGPNLCVWYTQLVTKMPDGGRQKSEFPWHQDNGYGNVDPPTNITVWVALDNVNEENGCVYVVPQSHQRGLLPHGPASNGHNLEVPVEGNGVPAILSAGEAVAFTGFTIHRSMYNRTDKPRRAFFMQYCDAAGWYVGRSDQQPATRVRVVDRPHTWVVSGVAPVPDEL